MKLLLNPRQVVSPPVRPLKIPPRTRLTWAQVVISILIAGLGFISAHALSQIDADLQIMYREYTLAAVDLAHISAEVLRYRVTILQAIESSTNKEFEQLTAPLADRRARIQHAVDRYAAASLRVSRSGRSEPQDLQAVQQSLDAYFSSASKTITLLIRSWNAETPGMGAALRHEAEVHAADNAGPKLIQVTLALDRLLETVTDVAKDLRDEGTRGLQGMTWILTGGAVAIAVLNLFPLRRTSRPILPRVVRSEVAEPGDVHVSRPS
jgi:hypothetical protein